MRLVLPLATGMLFETIIPGAYPIPPGVPGLEKYGGLTRARHRLYLTHASMRATWGRGGFSVPSRFLLEIPDDPYDESMWHDAQSEAQHAL